MIPQGHPVLNPSNIGQFGVRQILAIAANRITWSWRSVDQIAIFGAVVAGLIMIFIQAILIAAYAVLGTAHASSANEFFTTPEANVQTDVVLIFLEQVFGPNLDFFGAATQPLGTPVVRVIDLIGVRRGADCEGVRKALSEVQVRSLARPKHPPTMLTST